MGWGCAIGAEDVSEGLPDVESLRSGLRRTGAMGGRDLAGASGAIEDDPRKTEGSSVCMIKSRKGPQK
jgi:hypothetical protein